MADRENNNSGSPLAVTCGGCGSPVFFDIIRQVYRCPACGRQSGIEDEKEKAMNWKLLRKQDTKVIAAGMKEETCECPACGAKIVFAPGEASETCDFCGNRLIRKQLADPEQLPEIIIPFFITPEEAGERLDAWARKNIASPEGRAIRKNRTRMCGYYLPYRIVKGPVSAEVRRDNTARRYHCRGYLAGEAVSTSKQLDDRVLDGIEPFDFTKARPFAMEYIAGEKVKLNDLSEKDVDNRVIEGAKADFLPEVERIMQTTGVSLDLDSGGLVTLNALLPVYFIRSGNLLAAMNGQTGRIAASQNRKKVTWPWIIEPLFYTLLLTFLFGKAAGFHIELMLYALIFFACVIFSAMGEGRTSLIRDVIIRSVSSAASREEDRLKIREGKEVLPEQDTRPVFFEENRKGEEVPVRIRFYSLARWISILFSGLVTVFLPVILAAPIRLAEMEEGERFLDSFEPRYGGAWYIIAAVIVLLYYVQGVRVDVYEHPLLYEIKENGKLKLMGKRSERKIGILSYFGFRLGGGKFSWKDMADDLSSFLILFFGFGIILLGSTLAIVY